MVLIPLLGTFYEHLASNEFGADILLGDIQHACYKILDCLYRIGTTYAAPQHEEAIFMELARHRPVIGECITAFAACFPVAFLEPEYTSTATRSSTSAAAKVFSLLPPRLLSPPTPQVILFTHI